MHAKLGLGGVDKKQDKSPDEPDFAQVSEQLAKLDPMKEESEQEKRFDFVWKGGTLGAVVGLAIAQVIVSRDFVFGIYVGGDLGVLLLKFTGGGAAIGASLARLNMRFFAGSKR
jgi:hypothetical protein